MPLHQMPSAGARHTLDALGGSVSTASGPSTLTLLMDGVAGSSASLLFDWNAAAPWMWVGLGVYLGSLGVLAAMAWRRRAAATCFE